MSTEVISSVILNYITAELINQAKLDINDQKQGSAEHPAPLKAKDVVIKNERT